MCVSTSLHMYTCACHTSTCTHVRVIPPSTCTHMRVIPPHVHMCVSYLHMYTCACHTSTCTHVRVIPPHVHMCVSYLPPHVHMCVSYLHMYTCACHTSLHMYTRITSVFLRAHVSSLGADRFTEVWCASDLLFGCTQPARPPQQLPPGAPLRSEVPRSAHSHPVRHEFSSGEPQGPPQPGQNTVLLHA